MAFLTSRLGALLRRTRTDRKGVAAIEFGIVAPILVTVLIAVVDIGSAIQQNIRLEAAARSALGYAHVYSSDATGIRSMVLNALSGWNNVNMPVPTMQCYCGTATTTSSCAVDCSVGVEQRRELSVTVTRPYSGMVFLQNRTLTGNVQMRVQ